jgi:hypothetical protein
VYEQHRKKLCKSWHEPYILLQTVLYTFISQCAGVACQAPHAIHDPACTGVTSLRHDCSSGHIQLAQPAVVTERLIASSRLIAV